MNMTEYKATKLLKGAVFHLKARKEMGVVSTTRDYEGDYKAICLLNALAEIIYYAGR